jgi:hypothetical protein
MDAHRYIGRRVLNLVLVSHTQRSRLEVGRDAMLQWMVVLPSQHGRGLSPRDFRVVPGSSRRCASIVWKGEPTCWGRRPIDSRILVGF